MSEIITFAVALIIMFFGVIAINNFYEPAESKEQSCISILVLMTLLCLSLLTI